MRQPICPNCRTPKNLWTENKREGYRIDNHVFCSRTCSEGADKSIREHGSIDQIEGKKEHEAELEGH